MESTELTVERKLNYDKSHQHVETKLWYLQACHAQGATWHLLGAVPGTHNVGKGIHGDLLRQQSWGQHVPWHRKCHDGFTTSLICQRVHLEKTSLEDAIRISIGGFLTISTALSISFCGKAATTWWNPWCDWRWCSLGGTETLREWTNFYSFPSRTQHRWKLHGDDIEMFSGDGKLVCNISGQTWISRHIDSWN